MRPIRGLLFDLDGVLHVEDRPIPGAAETVRRVKAMGILCRFLTNTTTKSLERLHRQMTGMGLPIEKGEILSAPQAAIQYLRQRGRPSCFLVLNEEVRADFEEFPPSETDPDCVVIGDVWDRWDYRLLNKLFHLLIGGADLIALHKGRYWQTGDGLQLDIGAFVAALEYASGKEAIVMGKPSPDFFRTALLGMGLRADEVVMVGDDIESDVGGAQRAGIRGILVKTGKYRDELVARSSVRPDYLLRSVADLLRWLE